MNNTKTNQNYLFFICKTKNNKENFEIKLPVIRRSTLYKAESKKCNFSLSEKLHNMTGEKSKLLNKSNELINKGRHVDKFLLKNYTSRKRGRGRGGGKGR